MLHYGVIRIYEMHHLLYASRDPAKLVLCPLLGRGPPTSGDPTAPTASRLMVGSMTMYYAIVEGCGCLHLLESRLATATRIAVQIANRPDSIRPMGPIWCEPVDSLESLITLMDRCVSEPCELF